MIVATAAMPSAWTPAARATPMASTATTGTKRQLHVLQMMEPEYHASAARRSVLWSHRPEHSHTFQVNLPLAPRARVSPPSRGATIAPRGAIRAAAVAAESPDTVRDRNGDSLVHPEPFDPEAAYPPGKDRGRPEEQDAFDKAVVAFKNELPPIPLVPKK